MLSSLLFTLYTLPALKVISLHEVKQMQYADNTQLYNIAFNAAISTSTLSMPPNTDLISVTC